MQKCKPILLKQSVAALALATSLSGTAFAQTFASQTFRDQSLAPANNAPYMETKTPVDYSLRSAAYPSHEMPYWTRPNSTSWVPYWVEYLFSDVSAGTCYEISTAESYANEYAYIRNQAGNWVHLAGGNFNSTHLRARVFVTARAQIEVRISPFASPGSNAYFIRTLKRIKGGPGSGTGSTNCRQSGIPYWEYSLNSGNPL